MDEEPMRFLAIDVETANADLSSLDSHARDST